MRQALLGFGALLVAACGPDLSDNDAPRCDETLVCGSGLSCYRGFCVPDDVIDTPPTGPVLVDPVTGVDGGLPLASEDAALPEAQVDAAQVEVVDASVPSEPPPSEPPPAAPAPEPPAPAPAVDAGVPGTGKCTLKECCDEARKAYEESLDEDDEASPGGKKGKCGCRTPDLFNTITCGLGSLTGLT